MKVVGKPKGLVLMRIRRTVLATAATVGLLAAAAVGQPAQATSKGLDGIALYSGGTKLARFDSNRPDRAKKIGDVRKLVGDTSLVGIDRRVQNGRLYGVGDQGGIYVLGTRSAKARKVGQLSIALDGTAFGVDFNPAANALRVISDTGQNLRQPFGTDEGPSAPTVVDGVLNYLGVTAVGVTAAAYTNNDLSADTATTLFDLDTTLDQVALQSPANSGSLVATGKLGVNAGSDAGFDIYSAVSGGRTTSLRAFAAIHSGSSYRLYSVNLLTGKATSAGSFNKSVTDLALDLDH